MAYLDKVKIGSTTIEVHDSRVSGIDATLTEDSNSLASSHAVFAMTGDIQVALDSILGVTKIDFSIGGDAYQAEKDMTWEVFVSSSYNRVPNPYTGSGSTNNGNWFISNNIIHRDYDVASTVYIVNVLPTDTIIANHSYSTAYGMAPGEPAD